MAIVLFLAVIFAKSRIKSSIEKFAEGQFTYQELAVDILGRNISFHDFKTSTGKYSFSAEEIRLENISYTNYLFQKNFVVEKVSLQQPLLVLKESKKDSSSSSSSKEFKNEIRIDFIEAREGKILKKGKGGKNEKYYLAFNEFDLRDVVLNEETLKKGIPLDYSSFQLEADSLFLNLGKLHYFTVGEISARGEKLQLRDIQIIPKYDKVEFQQHIPYEKDRFELRVDSLEIADYNWNFIRDTLFFHSELLSVNGADFEAYRNKLMPDDTTIKPMYSELLRELPIKLNVEKVQVKNSAIVYEEKNHKERPPLKVIFSGLDATIQNLGNTALKKEVYPTTKVEVHSNFMSEAPVVVNWAFDVHNLQENFTISGNMGALNAASLNKALKPAMNIKSEGKINSLAFNYSGNQNTAQGDMRIHYRDFDIIVLQEDGTEKNSFLSAIVNLFVSSSSKDGKFVRQDLTVERNKQKSFWNYFWLMIREGALKIFL